MSYAKRFLFCGDRNWTDRDLIRTRLEGLASYDTVVHGACRGADRIEGEIAEELGLTVEAYPADWKRYGRGAGPIRNQQMLDSGIHTVCAFHNDILNSKGTADMCARATAIGKSVEIWHE